MNVIENRLFGMFMIILKLEIIYNKNILVIWNIYLRVVLIKKVKKFDKDKLKLFLVIYRYWCIIYIILVIYIFFFFWNG